MAKTSQLEQEIEVTIKVHVPKGQWERYSQLCKTAGWAHEGQYLSRAVEEEIRNLFEYGAFLSAFMQGPSKEEAD